MKAFYVGAVMVAIGLALGASWISAHNTANRLETSIQAQYESGQNTLSQFSLKVVEMFQITNAYKDDFQEIIEGQMEGRYGEDGSKAMFQWLQENNINVDPTLYSNVQAAIEAGRNKFENSQEKLIDHKRTYEKLLGTFWTGTWMNIAGYPKIDLDDYAIIQSQYSLDAYETGIDSGLKLR